MYNLQETHDKIIDMLHKCNTAKTVKELYQLRKNNIQLFSTDSPELALSYRENIIRLKDLKNGKIK